MHIKLLDCSSILLMQQSVLSRPGNDNTRIPHFLIYRRHSQILFVRLQNQSLLLYRKYKVATVLDAQNLSQLEG